MSVRAYRINKIEREKDSSFNLWHDTELLDFFSTNGENNVNTGENGGQIEISIDIMEKALKELKLDKWIKDMLKKDIKWTKDKGDNWIMYDCY